MPFESYTTILQDARKRKYAVGAFNIFALEFLPAILKAAEEEKSPTILQINPIHYQHHDLPNYLAYVKAQIEKASVPVCLNLDHGKSREIILQGLQAGFPSVMFDGSKLPYDENLNSTAEIVGICKPCNVTVEAELGTLNDEGLELTLATQDRLFTDPEKAKQFVEKTGIDSLAVAIGNAHGFYKGEPKLDFERLETIRESVSVPLVLHGGSGITETDFKKAISLGICKINIYTEMSAGAFAAVEKATSDKDFTKDYPTLLSFARDEVKNVVKKKMQIFGSSGKAA
ncbi:MAG: class II fructose-bisphosphate aldolase [Calditrichaeota bacterium]|nr:class II fructose-bisphosphate aldolase [Calditrichota bacterium]